MRRLFSRHQASSLSSGRILGCILPTPNAPGQRAFLRCTASFFLEIRQYSCEKMSCSTQKFLAAGHIMSFQIHPRRAKSLKHGCHGLHTSGRSIRFARKQLNNSNGNLQGRATTYPYSGGYQALTLLTSCGQRPFACKSVFRYLLWTGSKFAFVAAPKTEFFP